MSEVPSRGMSLHTKILIGLVLGAVCGVAANTYRADLDAAWTHWTGEEAEAVEWVVENVMRPVGQIFLNLLFMTVVPLVFASLAAGVARLGDLRSLGRVGAKTFAFFVATMTVAVVIGLVMVNTLQPGAGLPKETKERMLEKYGKDAAKTKEKSEKSGFGIDTFVNIVPRNPLKSMVEMEMLSIIFFALLVGVGLTVIDPGRALAVLVILDGITDLMVVIINLAMRVAPYGVFALIFRVTADFGFDILKQLALYVAIVVVGIGIQMFGVLSVLVYTLARMNPLHFFRKVWDVIVTAFSTSSSNATLPTSIKTAEEELGIPPQIAGFVLPLGATMNMNGTALFEGVTVMFLAQVFGIELTLGEQVVVVVLAVLSAIGAAGVPGGALPLLVMVLATVGVPEMGIALILGVDRLLDMCRTTLNVVGDLAAATFVARSEGFELR